MENLTFEQFLDNKHLAIVLVIGQRQTGYASSLGVVNQSVYFFNLVKNLYLKHVCSMPEHLII